MQVALGGYSVPRISQWDAFIAGNGLGSPVGPLVAL